MSIQIYPSLLSADLMHLHEEVSAVMKAGADMLHLDIMDNHYVPNLTFGPMFCQALHQQFPSLPLDVHIMATPVDDLILQFVTAGAQRISIHPDATIHLDRSLELIKKNQCEAGLVINPATSLDCVDWCLHRLDFLLIMTVNPGFGGQMMLTEMIKKIEIAHQRYPELPICVDGGITQENIALLSAAGATQFVAGSAIFKATNYADAIQGLRNVGGNQA